MATIETPGIEYRDDEWPHGLACMDCRRVLHEGDRYSERLYAFVENVPLAEVVCLDCATAEEQEHSARRA
jgi:hypothetical protein